MIFSYGAFHFYVQVMLYYEVVLTFKSFANEMVWPFK